MLLDECAAASSLYTLERPDFRLAGARFDVSRREAEGYWEFLRLAPDLFVMTSDMTYHQRTSVAVPGEDLIEFHFHLNGKLSLLPEPSKPVELAGPSLLIWRQSRGHDITEYIGGGMPNRTMTIYCRPSALKRYFGNYLDTLPDGVRPGMAASCPETFFLRSALYPSLLAMAGRVLDPVYEGPLRLVNAEGAVIGILCEILRMLGTYHTGQVTTAHKLTDRDVRCLEAARDIVVREHAPPPTIADIAHRVGMSTTKLKGGFKLFFGKTIHEFANDLRMTHALDLLRKPDTSIAHVAETLGYEYQNSFTVAFKRHFGMLPKEYRRDPLTLRPVSPPRN